MAIATDTVLVEPTLVLQATLYVCDNHDVMNILLISCVGGSARFIGCIIAISRNLVQTSDHSRCALASLSLSRLCSVDHLALYLRVLRSCHEVPA